MSLPAGSAAQTFLSPAHRRVSIAAMFVAATLSITACGGSGGINDGTTAGNTTGGGGSPSPSPSPGPNPSPSPSPNPSPNPGPAPSPSPSPTPAPVPPYVDSGPAPGDGSGGGVGDGDGSGAGSVGGVEGQFRNVSIHVELADGRVIGEATVDDTYGMVHADVGDYQGPVKFTLSARADGSSQYFDEGKGALLPFPAGETRHSVVATYDKNVGITPLTEAAYQYIVAKYGQDGWKNAANIREANEAIRVEFNRQLPVGLQIEDITRLPAIVGPDTKDGSLPATKNGLYGTVLAGLTNSAALFNVGESAPALAISRQLMRDLSDGKLDLFFCANGDPVNCRSAPVFDGKNFTAPASMYSAPQFAEMFNTGVSQMSGRYGDAKNQAAALQFTQVKIFVRDAANAGTYNNTAPMFLLRNDGNVYFWPRRDQPMTLYAKGFRQLYAASSMLGSTRDGKVFKDPVIDYGDPNDPNAVAKAAPPVEAPDYAGTTRLAGTPETVSSKFNQIVRKLDGNAYLDTQATSGGGAIGPAVLNNVMDVAVARTDTGAGSYYAATATGNVYAWGRNGAASTLGLDRSDETIAAPTLSPYLQEIVSVAGCASGGFALDRTGKVWGWGAGTIECAAVNSRVPVTADRINEFGSVAQLQCASFWGCLAVTNRGELILWGRIRSSSSATTIYETPPFMLQMPNGQRAIYVGATSLFVYALLDDGKVAVFETRPQIPTLIDTDNVPIR